MLKSYAGLLATGMMIMLTATACGGEDDPSSSTTYRPQPPAPSFPTPSAQKTDPLKGVDTGDCLSGELTSSQEFETVDALKEVVCSSGDADYRVLAIKPFATSKDACDSIRGTRYVYKTTYSYITTTYCLATA